MLSVILCLWCFVAAGSASPISNHGYYPRSYIMGGSFYSNPRYVRAGNPGYDYVAPGQMTAMVVGDTVATNSFAGTPAFVPSTVVFPPKEGVEEQTTERQSVIAEPDSVNETEPEEVIVSEGEQETLFSIEEGTTETVTKAAPVTTTTKAPRKVKVGKAKRPATPQPEEEDEEPELASWPFLGSAKGVPAYNAFFPIFINGGSASGRSRAQEGNIPGSATAIANAFSTGKGGVATSHATAFGDPYAAAVLRNAGLFNVKRKLQPVAELED